MVKAKYVDTRPIEERREEWLRKYPDRFLACRTGHAFPRPVPGRRKMPRTRMEPWHDPDGRIQGCYYIEQSCGNCGRIRWKITGPRGSYYTDSTKWHYSDPSGYASPAGLGLTYGDYAELFWTRLIEGDQYTEQAAEELEEAK
jgi:hypothetical protein